MFDRFRLAAIGVPGSRIRAALGDIDFSQAAAATWVSRVDTKLSSDLSERSGARPVAGG